MELVKTLTAFCLSILMNSVIAQVTHPPLEYQKNTNKTWQVTEDFITSTKLNSSQQLFYKIDKGYITNFRSGPSIIDYLIKKLDPNNNNLNVAWLIHDVNYEGYVTQDEADRLLRNMLMQAGISPDVAGAVYYGLKFFGRNAYSDFKNNILVHFSKDEKNVKTQYSRPYYGMAFHDEIGEVKWTNVQKNNSIDFSADTLSQADVKFIFTPDDSIINQLKVLFPIEADSIIGNAGIGRR
jgi:hypothetical protein